MPTPLQDRRPAGRPPKVENAHRWHLIVNREERDRAIARAARKGHGDVTDVLRALLHAYNAGQLDAYAAPAKETH